MDWSDDCAYSVHDLEDAIFAGQVSVKTFEKDFADFLSPIKRLNM
jgi:dGTPase